MTLKEIKEFNEEFCAWQECRGCVACNFCAHMNPFDIAKQPMQYFTYKYSNVAKDRRLMDILKKTHPYYYSVVLKFRPGVKFV